MIVICKNCGNDIILSADNIGLKINYYGECNKCGTHYDVDYDARTKDKTRENWWMPTNKDKK